MNPKSEIKHSPKGFANIETYYQEYGGNKAEHGENSGLRDTVARVGRD